MTSPIDYPFHEGELAVQQRLNQTGLAHMNSIAISDSIPDGALRFIEQQAMVVIGSMNAEGQVWASVLFGAPGFVRALDSHLVELNIEQLPLVSEDPVWENLRHNQSVGLIFIELSSRRRLRVNGRMEKLSETHYVLHVERAYPNCPKYIQRRVFSIKTQEHHSSVAEVSRGTELNPDQQRLIRASDTFFVASAHPTHGVDASHRGGHPGFVNIVNRRVLRVPDLVGNGLFNTLGNFSSHPYAGLVFLDFKNNRTLLLTGEVKILWDMDDPQEETGGTKRYWQFDITSWQEHSLPVSIDWDFLDASPHIPPLKPVGNVDGVLRLRVEEIQQKSERAKSFRLRAVNNEFLPGFEAGAHIKVKIVLPNGTTDYRSYSLLNGPGDQSHYDIAVLKEENGRGGSLFLHEQINEGDELECLVPENDFPMEADAQHSILIAGGIGITPILAMLHTLSAQGKSFEIHYSARTHTDLLFRDQIEQMSGGNHYFYSSTNTNAQENFQRLDLRKLLATPEPGAHVYVCGPQRMIQAVRDISAESGWSNEQIHFESFGAGSGEYNHPIQVKLVRSNKSVLVPAQHSILDTLLEAGVPVPHSCKRGECAMCVTRVLRGIPDHRDLCLTPEQQSDSMCVCVSRAQGEELELDL